MVVVKLFLPFQVEVITLTYVSFAGYYPPIHLHGLTMLTSSAYLPLARSKPIQGRDHACSVL